MEQSQLQQTPIPPPIFIDPHKKIQELERWDVGALRTIYLWKMRHSGLEWEIAYETAIGRRESILSETQQQIAHRHWNRLRGWVYSGEFMPKWQMEALMVLQELRKKHHCN